VRLYTRPHPLAPLRPRRARDWLSGSLNFEKRGVAVSFFEATIRLLGGLLSCYDMAGDHMCLEKATDLGTRLVRNFPREGTGECCLVSILFCFPSCFLEGRRPGGPPGTQIPPGGHA
jgi:hypothetical protein